MKNEQEKINRFSALADRAVNDDELEKVTGGFNLKYSCDQWALRPGPFPFDDDCRFCVYCVHRKNGNNGDYCELGRQ